MKKRKGNLNLYANALFNFIISIIYYYSIVKRKERRKTIIRPGQQQQPIPRQNGQQNRIVRANRQRQNIIAQNRQRQRLPLPGHIKLSIRTDSV